VAGAPDISTGIAHSSQAAGSLGVLSARWRAWSPRQTLFCREEDGERQNGGRREEKDRRRKGEKEPNGGRRERVVRRHARTNRRTGT